MSGEPNNSTITPDSVRQAIRKHELFLRYLPTIRLRDWQCVGAEALVRWQRDGKIVPPMAFVPVVEATPEAGLLTYWVLEEVGRDLGAWLTRPDTRVHIGVNVPPELLGRGSLEYATEKAGLASVAHKLVLEISERGLIDQLGVKGLNQRHAQGVLIALDDIQLREVHTMLLSRVKLDIVKLDMTVIASLGTNHEDERTVRLLQALALVPDLAIIAEGVERVGQAHRLKEMGIGYAQGYLFSQPLPAKEFIAFHDSFVPDAALRDA